MPYVVASNSYKIRLLDHVGKDRAISMSFRTWELYEYQLFSNTTTHVWTVHNILPVRKASFRYFWLSDQSKGCERS